MNITIRKSGLVRKVLKILLLYILYSVAAAVLAQEVFCDQILKRQCHEIFFFNFFSRIIFPKPLKITFGSFRFYWKIWGDIHKSRCSTSINDTGGKFLPMSMTPVCLWYQRLAANFAHQYCWCCWHQWQIVTGTTTPGANNGNNIRWLSWHLKWTWRKKFIYMLTLLPKGVQKNNNNFSDFFHFPPVSFPPVSMTPVVHLELRLSPWIF
jgi:hypothetical protein